MGEAAAAEDLLAVSGDLTLVAAATGRAFTALLASHGRALDSLSCFLS